MFHRGLYCCGARGEICFGAAGEVYSVYCGQGAVSFLWVMEQSLLVVSHGARLVDALGIQEWFL